MDGRRVLEIYDKMVADRGSMPAIWDEVIRYCFPQEHVTYSAFGGDSREAGWRRANPCYSYPVIFTQRMGSAIHSNAFPANDYWFDFGIVGEDFENDETLKMWCRKARDTVHLKIRQGTNFYQESHAMMVGLGALGTAAFYTYYKNGGLKFRYIPIHKNFLIASNSDGEIDMAAIMHSWTAKEAIEEYGRDKVSPEIIAGLDAAGTQTYDFVQLIYPKKTFGERYSLARGQKPYGDVTVEYSSGKVMKTEQHSSFPFAVPRFFVYSDDLYGRSPAMNAMADIRAANALRKNILDASVRSIKPPIFVDAMLGDVSIGAGAKNIVRGMDRNSIWTYPQPTQFEIADKLQENLEQSLRQAFFIDVFQAIEQQKYMTATEVTERVRQKVESISPIVTRIQKEFSSRVILRSLELLIENGDVEPPPVTRPGGMLNVTYISSLDYMIRQGMAAKMMNFISQLSQFGQTLVNFSQVPGVVDVLNTDAIVQALADANTLPANFFRNKNEVQQQRQAQAQQAQQAQQANVDNMNARSLAELAKAAGPGENGNNLENLQTMMQRGMA